MTTQEQNTEGAITYEEASRLVAAVHQTARHQGLALSAVVVDAGGHPVCVGRMDGASFGSVEIALDKAYTAVAWQTPTARWADEMADGGGLAFAGLLRGRHISIAGGLPILRNGSQPVGALAVSGGSPDQDHNCAADAIKTVFDNAPSTADGHRNGSRA